MRKAYLSEQNIDDLARMLTALLTEVWVVRDRMAVLEHMLADKVGLRSEDIDNHVPDPELAAELERLRDRLIGAVVSAPLAPEDNGVDAVLRRAGMARPPSEP